MNSSDIGIFPLIIGVLSVELAHKCIPKWDLQARIAGTTLSVAFAFIGTVLFMLVIHFL
jgi:hypothetical protein